MESELTCFAKMIDISSGNDIYVKNVRNKNFIIDPLCFWKSFQFR